MLSTVFKVKKKRNIINRVKLLFICLYQIAGIIESIMSNNSYTYFHSLLSVNYIHILSKLTIFPLLFFLKKSSDWKLTFLKNRIIIVG